MSPAWTQIFVDQPWLASLVWVLLHSLDYFLTLYGSYLYHSGAKRVLTYAGSYELNPLFQGAIDKRKLLSVRFLLSLTLVAVALYVVAWAAPEQHDGDLLLAFIMGALVFPRIGLIGLHLMNVRLYRSLLRPDCPVVGSITWDRRSSYFNAVGLFATWAALLGFAAAVAPSAWLFGGLAGCALAPVYLLLVMPRRRSPDGKESKDEHHAAEPADALRPGAERP